LQYWRAGFRHDAQQRLIRLSRCDTSSDDLQQSTTDFNRNRSVIHAIESLLAVAWRDKVNSI
jgi:hypothetical protein